jgi:hypothetical protein
MATAKKGKTAPKKATPKEITNPTQFYWTWDEEIINTRDNGHMTLAAALDEAGEHVDDEGYIRVYEVRFVGRYDIEKKTVVEIKEVK